MVKSSLNNHTTYDTSSASDRLQILMKHHGMWLDESDPSCVCVTFKNKVILRYVPNIHPAIIYKDILDWMEHV